jgi:hypothetical protein
MIAELGAPLKLLNDQGSYLEFTVAQKLNHGTIRKKGCNLFPGSFFGYFFGEAKK